MQRRRFLQTVLGGGAAAAVARPSQAAASGTAGRGAVKRGYRETEHVRRYYRTARF